MTASTPRRPNPQPPRLALRPLAVIPARSYRHSRPLLPSFRRRPESRGAQAPGTPLSLQGERTPRTRRERVLRTGRVAFRHSCVGRNPFGAPAPQTGRSPVSMDPPPPPSFPRKREPTGGRSPPTMTSPPCADAPLIPYDGHPPCAGDRRKAGEAGKGAPHSASFLPQTAPIPPQTAPNLSHRQPETTSKMRQNDAK